MRQNQALKQAENVALQALKCGLKTGPKTLVEEATTPATPSALIPVEGSERAVLVCVCARREKKRERHRRWVELSINVIVSELLILYI